MNDPSSVLVAVEDKSDKDVVARGLALAEKLESRLVSNLDGLTGYLLLVGRDGLALRETTGRSSVSIDFLGGRTGFRRVAAGGKRQPLARALGVHKGAKTIVDATAGLGRDAFLLAAIGCEVVGVERSAVLFEMLCDAQARAKLRGGSDVRGVIERMRFVEGDSREYLERLDDGSRPDAIYIDPMYSEREGTALSKKEMRIVRDVVGDDGDAAELLATARTTGVKRVVVKRHPDAAPLAEGRVASHGGKRVRYDVYAG